LQVLSHCQPPSFRELKQRNRHTKTSSRTIVSNRLKTKGN
jgi:guanylate kinase